MAVTRRRVFRVGARATSGGPRVGLSRGYPARVRLSGLPTFPRGITCPVPSRWLRERKPSGPHPLLGPNLRGKILPRSHPPRIQQRSCLVLQECVLLHRCTLPSTSPETQPHLPSGALLFT